MRHLPLPLALSLALLGVARAEERGGDLKALQAAVEKAIQRAQPSIACIYVSRSESYHKAPFWGVRPAADEPGKLGVFDAAAAAQKVPARFPGRSRILRTIRDHDLSRPSAVPESYGSGLVLDASGLILTNAHVVRNATKLYVRLPGGRGSWADIHASDPRSDLAVLRLLDKVPDLEAIPLGDAGTVREGQFVLALSSVFAPRYRDGKPSSSWGLVSSLRRRAPGNVNEMERGKITLHHYGTLIQTDARISLGCSGGALLDLDGKLIGLTTALAGVRGAQNPGAQAIPVDADTKQIIEVLKRGEEVEYGFLGVVLRPPGDGVRGVQVYRVAAGSPAARAGLQPGDSILRVNGKVVRENDDLFLYVGLTLAGQTARLEIDRPGVGRRFLEVPVAKFYVAGPVIASRRPLARGGLRVDYLSILSQRGPLGAGPAARQEGVAIREVVPGSPAEKAALQPDKVITQVNGRAVPTPADYYREMARASSRVELTILDSEGKPERVPLELR